MRLYIYGIFKYYVAYFMNRCSTSVCIYILRDWMLHKTPLCTWQISLLWHFVTRESKMNHFPQKGVPQVWIFCTNCSTNKCTFCHISKTCRMKASHEDIEHVPYHRCRLQSVWAVAFTTGGAFTQVWFGSN